MSWLSTYKYRQKLTVTSNELIDINNFPLLVKLDASNFDFTKSYLAGIDIIFTDSDGVTELAFERVLFNSLEKSAIFFVNIPIIASNKTTDFFIYYGNQNAIDKSSTAFDSTVLAAYHFEQNNKFKDSSKNNIPPVPFGVFSNSTGVIDDGLLFDGNSYLEVTNFKLAPADDFTIDFWVNFADLSQQYIGLVSQRDSYATMDWQAFVYSNYRINLWIGENGATKLFTTSGPIVTTNTWYKVTLTKQGNNYSIFCNGVLVATENSTTLWNTTDTIRIGKLGGDTDFYNFRGVIDEFRFYSVSNTSEWTNFDYLAATENVIFFGSVEQVLEESVQLPPSCAFDFFTPGIAAGEVFQNNIIKDIYIPGIVAGEILTNKGTI